MDLNLLQQIIEAPKIRKFGNPKITRAGLITNPLQNYSFTTGDIYKDDELVTVNGKIVETPLSKTYDFLNKIARSVKECPMKIYQSRSASILTPSNIGGTYSTGFMEVTSQATIDTVKSLNANTFDYSSQNSGDNIQLMVELDLTDLANELGGNTKLKSLLTGITVDCWAKGSGAGGNGVVVKPWNNNGSTWSFGGGGSSATNTIQKISGAITIPTDCADRVNSSNKLYVLVASNFASDGVTASSVSLDYISVKIDYKKRDVTSDGAFFVGGDTSTYEFDMGLKFAGSVVECPMRIYWSAGTTPIVPTGTWSLYHDNTQSEVDLIKTQGTGTMSDSTTANGYIGQFMLELDLTPLCNSLYGGSNSALKSALKAITADVWAMGSGAGGNGAGISWWYDNGGTGGYWGSAEIQPNPTISKITNSRTAGLSGYLTSNNKLYLLVKSQYASNGTIPSSVSLDYFNIKIDLARTPDTVQPQTVNLGKYWAMVVKGFSPSWDANNTGVKCIAEIYKNASNRAIFSADLLNKELKFSKTTSGTTVALTSYSFNWTKNQTINFLIGQSASGMFVYMLKNNGTIVKLTNTDSSLLSGLYQLYSMQNDANVQQNDAFAESFHLVDLQRIGKPNGFTDAEAVSILKGQMHIKENTLIVNGDFSNGVTGWASAAPYGRPSSISAANNTLSVVGTTTSDVGVNQNIVTDASKYYVKFNARVTNSVCQLIYETLSAVRMDNPVINQWYTLSKVFTSTVGTQQVTIFHRYADVTTAIGMVMEVKEVSVINLTALFGAGNEPTQAQCDALFAQGSTNPLSIQNRDLFDISKVQLHANASVQGNSIVLNATGSLQGSIYKTTVLPNNRYELKGIVTGLDSRIDVQYCYNNTGLGFASGVVDKTTSSLSFVTPNNCNSVQLVIRNWTTTGTFTFSDISLKRKD